MCVVTYRYDPSRVAHMKFKQTIKYLGWELDLDVKIGERLTVQYALEERFCAFEVSKHV